jgi:hypothetical protein
MSSHLDPLLHLLLLLLLLLLQLLTVAWLQLNANTTVMASERS